DSRFHEEWPELRRLTDGRMITLNVQKRPSLSDFSNLARLRRFVSNGGADIIHGHGAKGGAYARLLGKLCGAKAVYTPHGGSLHRAFHPAEDLVYRAAEKGLLGWTDYFVFESGYSADAFFEKTRAKPPRWVVNHNGVPPVDASSA